MHKDHDGFLQLLKRLETAIVEQQDARSISERVRVRVAAQMECMCLEDEESGQSPSKDGVE